MTQQRPSIFEDDDLDLDQFSPKPTTAVSSSVIREVAEQGGFHSRTLSRTAKTGRTVLLNARITQRAHDRFHAIVEADRLRYEKGEIGHRVTLGEVVERALAALERQGG
jgi:hypothetical protein